MAEIARKALLLARVWSVHIKRTVARWPRSCEIARSAPVRSLSFASGNDPSCFTRQVASSSADHCARVISTFCLAGGTGVLPVLPPSLVFVFATEPDFVSVFSSVLLSPQPAKASSAITRQPRRAGEHRMRDLRGLGRCSYAHRPAGRRAPDGPPDDVGDAVTGGLTPPARWSCS